MTPPMDKIVAENATITVLKPRARKRDDYIRTAKGDIRPLMANVVTLLRQSPEWEGVLGFDEFSGRHMIWKRPPTDAPGTTFDPRPLGNKDIRAIIEWVQRNGVAASPNYIGEAILRVGDELRVHPVKNYLDALKWDGVDRLDKFLIEHAGVTDTPLNRAMTTRWMIQAIARIYQPGCQADSTLILEGEQGIGKSTLLKTLFGQWYADHLPELGSKDAMVQLRGTWCIEIAELATLTRADANRIKAFLTCREDRFREPYGRLAENVARSNVFAGSVNPGGLGYLKDATGARRFWPLEVPQTIDIKAVAKIRDQLWAEARHRFEKGEVWHLDDDVLGTAAAEAQAERFETDPWHEAIETWTQGKPEVSIDDILTEVVSLDRNKRGQLEQNRVAKVLKHLKWTRRLKRKNGSRSWVYEPPAGVTSSVTSMSSESGDTPFSAQMSPVSKPGKSGEW